MKAREIMVPVTLYLKPDHEIKDFIMMLKTHREQDRTSSSKSLPVLAVASVHKLTVMD
jgi:hypothetical protein